MINDCPDNVMGKMAHGGKKTHYFLLYPKFS